MSWYQSWFVVSDLDGTLLDHNDYSWQPARAAIKLLREHRIPLVLSSSKTLAEMRQLADEIETSAPLIVENGAAVAWPVGAGYEVQSIGRPRREVIAVANALRLEFGYKYEGFADWSAADVVRHTGLPMERARCALDRHGTEPILWRDSEEAYEAFVQAIAADGIRAIAGGRFIHLMGNFDKVDGLKVVKTYYQDQWRAPVQVLALGDSPNDAAMLSAAEVAVKIRSEKSAEMSVEAPVILEPSAAGPGGWAEAVQAWWQSQGYLNATE